jgi:hypothetical protein
MTTSGGAGTPLHRAQLQLPCVRCTGFSHRVGAPKAPRLRPFAMPHPGSIYSYHQLGRQQGKPYATTNICLRRMPQRTTSPLEYPYHPPSGRGSYGAPAVYCPWPRSSYFSHSCLARPSLCLVVRCAELSVMRPCLSPVGRARYLRQYPATYSTCSAHRLLSWGRSSYRTPSRGSHSSLCPAPVPIGHPYILWCWIKMQTRGCSYCKPAVLAGAFH